MVIVEKRASILKSFGFAFNGIWLSWRERNIKIHYLAMIAVLVAAWFFGVADFELYTILLFIAVIIALEMINTAMEILADIVSPEYNEQIGELKDISAGAVLWASVIAVCVALKIFIPKILLLL